jgi:phospholipase/lecithinase/hemolysin
LRLSTFAGQIGSFADILPALPAGDNPLTSVWFGANDLFSSFAPDNVRAAAAAVEAGIRGIRTVSASFDDFIVYNLSNLGDTPRYGYLAGLAGEDPADIAAVQAAANAATGLFNAELDQRLSALRSDGFNIVEVDFASIFDETVTAIQTAPGSAEALGMISAEVPCTVNMTAPLSGETNPFTCAPEEVNLLLFTDAVHPNAVAHAALADAARTALAPIPLPASMPLVLGGLALLGWVGRRRVA